MDTHLGIITLPTPPDRLADMVDLVRIIAELVDDGENPTYEALALEMDTELDHVRALIGCLIVAGWIRVPEDAGRPIVVLRRPEMPDFGMVFLPAPADAVWSAP